MIKKLHEALPKLRIVDTNALIRKSLNDHLVKVNRLIEWVQKEIKNDPLDALVEIDQTLSVMLAVHGPEERRKQWFVDKVAALNRQRAMIKSKNEKFDVLEAMEVENTLKSYRDSIHRELSMLEYTRRGNEESKETLKVMEVINGIKYHS